MWQQNLRNLRNLRKCDINFKKLAQLLKGLKQLTLNPYLIIILTLAKSQSHISFVFVLNNLHFDLNFEI